MARRLGWAAVAGGVLTWSGTALACPGHAGGEPSAWSLVFPVLLLLGVPAVLFSVMAPAPLPLRQRRMLWPMQALAFVLGLFLLVPGAWRERRRWKQRVDEALRERVALEGVTAWLRTWARRMPDSFNAVMRMATAGAGMATAAMWAWTVADPDVTWGQGFEVPVTFTADTVLTFVAVRWMLQRVGMHLAAGMVDARGAGRVFRTLFHAGLMGGAAGWLFGALFGLSSGIQTLAIVEGARPAYVPMLVGWYGINMFLVGAAACSLVGVALLATWKQPRGLLVAPR